MSSYRKVRERSAQQRRNLEAWMPEVLTSRIVIRPDETSYVDKVGVYVFTLLERAGKGVSDAQLMLDYPNLTQADLEACLKFIALRGKCMLATAYAYSSRI